MKRGVSDYFHNEQAGREDSEIVTVQIWTWGSHKKQLPPSGNQTSEPKEPVLRLVLMLETFHIFPSPEPCVCVSLAGHAVTEPRGHRLSLS